MSEISSTVNNIKKDAEKNSKNDIHLKSNSNTNTDKLFSTKNLVIMALMTAILCVSAYVSIPLPNGMHLTMLNFVITIIVLSFPIANSATIIGVWILIGAIGIPVFIGGNAGIGYLMGPLGGFTFSFLIVALMISPFTGGKNYSRIKYTIFAVISAVLVDMIGTLWYMIFAHTSFMAAFAACFLPFIVIDCIKVVVAAQLIPQISRLRQVGQ